MTAHPPTSPPPPAPPAQAGPALPGRQTRGTYRWPPWIAPLGLFAGFGIVVVASLIAGVIATAAGARIDHLPSGLNIGLTVFQDIALFATAVLFARSVTRRPPPGRDFGLRLPAKVGASVALMLAVWAGFFLVSGAWTLLLNLHEKTDLPEQLGADNAALNLVIVTVLVTVVAPLGEELFFRGFFFAALRNWKGLWPAAAITGLVFGAIHLGSAPVGQLVPLGFFGFGLCLLYQWTGSLYPGIALHALNNVVAFGVDQGWSWEIPVVMVAAVLVVLAVADGLRRVLDSVARGAARRSAAPAR